jgi:hypothetical protein
MATIWRRFQEHFTLKNRNLFDFLVQIKAQAKKRNYSELVTVSTVTASKSGCLPKKT